jgi:hypothetical protein
LTPEPERDLPAAIATLRAGGAPSPAQIEAERERAEQLVLKGNRKRWLAWLDEGLELADRAGDGVRSTSSASRPDVQEVAAAKGVLLDVIENHNELEKGLPDRRVRTSIRKD